MDDLSTRRGMDAVLPLAIDGSRDGQDLARAVTQARTLRHFFDREQLLRVNVVGRHFELPRIEDALRPFEAPWLQYRLRDERDVHPEMTRSPAQGWHKQQIVKMAAPEWLGAPFWLTLDADVICTRPVGIDDLLPNGRGLLDLVAIADASLYSRWAWATRELLGMIAPPLAVSMSITPLIYAEPIMRATWNVIESLHGRPWKDVLLDVDLFSEPMHATGRSWAENMLYYAVATRSGLLRSHHAVRGIDVPQSLICDGIWRSEDWAGWTPDLAFDRTRPGFFAVCSSYTGMPADVVAARIAPFLESDPHGPDAASSRPVVQSAMFDDNDEAAPAKLEFRARIICRRPLIVAGPYDSGLSCILSKGVLEPLREIPATVCVTLPWCMEQVSDAQRLAARIARRQRELPLHRFVVLCDTDVETDLFRQLGVACALVSHNALLDERVFLADQNVPVEYDAIYNARFEHFKRHELAAGIRSLALVYAAWDDGPIRTEYAINSRKALAHAALLNHAAADGSYRFLDRSELATQLARARVGLCLSPVEGAMRASVEYLFAGLPVVSTLNVGGRDQFFDADFCVNVPPTAGLVADAVRELAARNLSRDYVRRRTMYRLVGHRERFVQVVGQSASAMGCERMPAVKWPWLDEQLQRIYDPGTFVHAILMGD